METPVTKSGGSEALRILEGLKSRPKTYRGYSGINPPTATAMTVNTEHQEVYHGSSDNLSVTSSRYSHILPPSSLPSHHRRSTISRAQIQDKIRGTLSSISASLSLEPTPGSPLTRVSSGQIISLHFLSFPSPSWQPTSCFPTERIVIWLLASKDFEDCQRSEIYHRFDHRLPPPPSPPLPSDAHDNSMNNSLPPETPCTISEGSTEVLRSRY
jgi:hypothetical protein